MGNITLLKKLSLIIMAVCILLVEESMATTFQRMSLDQLAEETHAAAEVTLKSKKSFMNKMGVIMTDYYFEKGYTLNVQDKDLDGEFIKITLIGGKVDGVTSYIDGAPEFEVGEKSFLLLKVIDSKMYISNFTMGKYKVEEAEGKTFYVSSVFPQDPDIGRVSHERMITVLKSKIQSEKTTRVRPLNPNAVAQNPTWEKDFVKKRIPAQEFDPEDSREGLFVMWGFLALFLLSGVTIWWKLRQGVRE
jgi:hypothetical protein